MKSFWKFLLFSLVVIQNEAASPISTKKENIRADFYNLDAIKNFENIPDNVKLQVENEMARDDRRQYAYATRPGRATETHRCLQIDQRVPSHLTFITRYRFYSKYTHAYGIPVVAHRVVSDEAVRRACYVVRFLFADRKDIRDNMYKYFGRVAVIGRAQKLTAMPEFSNLPDWWNQRARGLGGTLHIPMSCGGEENLMCLREDRYYGDDIFFHEAAHAVAELAIKGGPGGDIDGIYGKLRRYYNSAKYKGLWRNTYSMSTVREYFAEGAQSFFNCHISANPPNGIHGSVATKSQLKGYDPDLYRLLQEVFPCENTYYRCRNSYPDMKMNCKVGGGGGGGGTRPTQAPRPTQQPTGDCNDDNSNCSYWAGQGFCSGKHQVYMKKNCKKSCKICGGGGGGGGGSDKSEHCGYWARNGYCQSNPSYMNKNCCKSCRRC